MTDKLLIDRTLLEQALDALLHRTGGSDQVQRIDAAITALRAALAQQAEPAQEPVAAGAKNATAQFDHGIGADRFKVVRGAYWWHVLIGDSQTKRGKFHTQAGAEEMAALLLREFRNGAFVQHEATPQQPEPVQEPLTDEEIVSCLKVELARAIERKVRGE